MVPDDEDIQDQQAIEAEHKAGNYNLRCNRNETWLLLALERKRLAESGWFNNSKKQRVIVKLQQNTPPNVVNHLQKLTYTQYPESIVCPPQSPSYTPLIALNLCRKPIYYQAIIWKLQRGLSQTPWCELRKELISRIVDGERKTEGSVEEDILGVLGEFIQSDGMKFHSAGREDMDVRMLFEGRPFVVEFDNARKMWFVKWRIQSEKS